MSATVIQFNSARHKPTVHESTTVVLDIDDFESIELEINAARSAMALAMKSVALLSDRDLEGSA